MLTNSKTVHSEMIMVYRVSIISPIGKPNRDQPIMLIFLPIMLCCSVQNFDLLCSILCSRKRIMLKI